MFWVVFAGGFLSFEAIGTGGQWYATQCTPFGLSMLLDCLGLEYHIFSLRFRKKLKFSLSTRYCCEIAGFLKRY